MIPYTRSPWHTWYRVDPWRHCLVQAAVGLGSLAAVALIGWLVSAVTR